MIPSSETETDNDVEYVRRAKTGCVSAFEILVRKYQMPLRHYLANRISDNATIDDIAQDVFMVAIKQIPSLQNDGSFGGWLLSIARNKCVDHIRKLAQFQRTSNEKLDYLVAVEKSERTANEDMAYQEKRREILHGCIAKLAPQSQELIRKFYFESKTAVEISTGLNRKSSSIRMSLLRIRKSLATCIQNKRGDR